MGAQFDVCRFGRSARALTLRTLRLRALIARALIVGIAAVALAHCSPMGSRYADDSAVPKGGGRYAVGKPYYANGRIYAPAEDPTYRAAHRPMSR